DLLEYRVRGAGAPDGRTCRVFARRSFRPRWVARSAEGALRCVAGAARTFLLRAAPRGDERTRGRTRSGALARDHALGQLDRLAVGRGAAGARNASARARSRRRVSLADPYDRLLGPA